MDLLFVKRHNVCAFLNANDPKAAEFIPVLNFLANSNISFAISNNLPVFETSIREFWETAEIITVENVEHIRATVLGQEVLFSEATVREVLQLNDNPDAPIEFPIFYVKECFRRLGHPDEFKTILGITKGRDYNFSGFIFRQLKDNLTGAVKEKFLAYPRFLQIIINHLHPELQQGGNIFVFDHMIAKTLSYMRSTNKRTNRAIADVPLFGHIIGEEEEEFIPDIDPDLEEENSSSEEEKEMEVEQDQGNPPIDEAEIEINIPIIQEEEQPIIQPVIEAPFVEQIQIIQEPAVNVEAGMHEAEEEIAESSETLDAGIYGSDYYKSDSDDRTMHLASSSKRQVESGSDFEEEEPKAKKIKTGFEDLSSSSDSLLATPQPSPQPTPQPTPQPSPQPTPQPTPQPSPQPSPQQSPIHTTPTSPTHDSTSHVPRVKTLSLELKKIQDKLQEKDEEIEGLKTNLHDVQEEVKDLKLEVGGLHTQIEIQQTQLETQQRLISQQKEEFKALAEVVEQLKTSMVKPVQKQPTTSTAQGETTSVVEPSSPDLVTNPESALRGCLGLLFKQLINLLPFSKSNPKHPLTIFAGHTEKTKEAVEVKVEGTELNLPSASERRDARKRGKRTSTEIETVILDEEDITSDDELNALLDDIENFGYNDLYPEILTTEEKETERTRYFTEDGDEIQTLSDEEKGEEDVQINLIKTVTPEPTTTVSESGPAQVVCYELYAKTYKF
ncbi:hypothetical protein L1987_85919 [Smallanthus sonchifolius]|uniref:Uncharacterized protein n=1 Tax=Smallanthus sonchifolius TaxID=185202 RepID=A0ACB8XXX6_9ASTR|nr:hypothetical protein L1987_85919 [Smallanthus sonchifolius]